MPRRSLFLLVAIAVLFALAPLSLRSQQTSISHEDKQTDLLMLKDAKETLEKNYYDPKLHGLDFDGLYEQYKQRVEGSTSNHQAFALIAGFVDSLHDTHTRFIPPPRVGDVEYGYRLQMIGDKCYVTEVRPGMDGVGKLHAGDVVVDREGIFVNRGNFLDMLYHFGMLAPVTASNFEILDQQGNERQVTVQSKMWPKGDEFGVGTVLGAVGEEEQQEKDEFYEKDGVFFWKMHGFIDDDFGVEAAFTRASKSKAMIIDLRGNGGGSVETLQNVLGMMFDHPIVVADRVGRKKLKPITIRPAGSHAYKGNIFVLVDSESASASEILARVVQIENRGTVIGDRTAGAVMEAEFFTGMVGGAVDYGFEVTEADLTMKDGASLEHVGVTPDHIVLPTAQDMAEGKDPVLAYAAQQAGAEMTPEQAAKLFPFQWPPMGK
jgi:carboxyl-terminal processing protease